MSVLTWILVDVTRSWFAGDHMLKEIGGLCVIIGGSMLGYAITLQLTGAMRLRDVTQILKRRAVDKAASRESGKLAEIQG